MSKIFALRPLLGDRGTFYIYITVRYAQFYFWRINCAVWMFWTVHICKRNPVTGGPLA